MSHPLKVEPGASIERCEERIAYWTDIEQRARAKGIATMLLLAVVAERARKQWAEALDVAMDRDRKAKRLGTPLRVVA